MPRFNKINLKDVEDAAAKWGYSDTYEARFPNKLLEMQQSGLSYQKLHPGKRSRFGHTEGTQEEVYIFIGGSGRMKLDDELVDVKKYDVVRIDKEVMRACEAGPDGLEMIIYGAPKVEKFDGVMDKEWWPR